MEICFTVVLAKSQSSHVRRWNVRTAVLVYARKDEKGKAQFTANQLVKSIFYAQQIFDDNEMGISVQYSSKNEFENKKLRTLATKTIAVEVSKLIDGYSGGGETNFSKINGEWMITYSWVAFDTEKSANKDYTTGTMIAHEALHQFLIFGFISQNRAKMESTLNKSGLKASVSIVPGHNNSTQNLNMDSEYTAYPKHPSKERVPHERILEYQKNLINNYLK